MSRKGLSGGERAVINIYLNDCTNITGTGVPLDIHSKYTYMYTCDKLEMLKQSLSQRWKP